MPMAEPRKCGGCTMCCWLPEQRELAKPAGEWCRHCKLGSGCLIYGQRPQGCREFECLWLKNKAIPEDLRPDRIGVVFEPLAKSRTCLALVNPNRPQAWRKPGPMHIISNLLRHGTAVVVTCLGHPPIVLAPQGTTSAEVNENLLAEVV